jgi:hypothetical protein
LNEIQAWASIISPNVKKLGTIWAL